MRPELSGCVLIFACALAGLTRAAAAGTTVRSQGTAAADADLRAKAIVRQLTLDEKLPQLLNVAPAILRLNIPAYNWWTESLHGANGPLATTNFPEPIALGASFDAPLVRHIAGAISEELRALHAMARRSGHLGRIGTGLDTWSPNINIYRDPRWGRGQETYGEDPYLTARLGVAFVRGMQGPDSMHPLVIATPKHFAVHSGPESTRHVADVPVSAHDLEDTYLPAFRAAIVEGQAGSIMCAYNSINGQPACANDLLLQQRLKTDWGFKGYVVSDCDALRDISEGHHFAPDEPAAVAVAFKTGVANECNTQLLQDLDAPLERYREAVRRGSLPETVIDETLVKLFAARFRNGDLPTLSAHLRPGSSPILSSAHQKLALRSAEEGMVLLKNDGQLPLRSSARLLVVGPLADATRVLRGNYSSPLSGSPISVLAGLQRVLPHAAIHYLPAAPSITDGDPVPIEALRSPDGKPGLLVEYFNPTTPDPAHFISEEDLKRRVGALAYGTEPVVSHIEPGVSPRAQALAPVHEYYRVTWRGSLVPKESGRYRVALGGTAGTLTLAGQPIAALNDVPWGTLPAYHTVELTGGTSYPLLIEARGSPLFDIQLLWKRIADPSTPGLKQAAADADVIVAVAGLTSDLEGEESKVALPGFSGGDRTELGLPADQQRLLEEAHATGKPLVIVLMNGGPIDLSWAKTHAAAILEAWYPGQAGGLAAARILSGQVDPSGRLPLTFYKDVSELPAFDDYSMTNRTYRYYSGTPVFPFGFGLSYTEFDYTDIRVTRQPGSGGTALLVSAQVRNAGIRPGTAVAQLYLKFPPSPGMPRVALRGFTRVSLPPGSRQSIQFRLSPRDLSSVSPEGVRRIAAGTYVIAVGSGMPGSGVASSETTYSCPESEPLPL